MFKRGDYDADQLERALQEAEQLPDELQEKIGDDLQHYIHKYLALRHALDAGLRELDAGKGIPSHNVFAELGRE